MDKQQKKLAAVMAEVQSRPDTKDYRLVSVTMPVSVLAALTSTAISTVPNLLQMEVFTEADRQASVDSLVVSLYRLNEQVHGEHGAMERINEALEDHGIARATMQ